MTRTERAQLIALEKQVETLVNALRMIRSEIDYPDSEDIHELLLRIAGRVDRVLTALDARENDHAP